MREYFLWLVVSSFSLLWLGLIAVSVIGWRNIVRRWHRREPLRLPFEYEDDLAVQPSVGPLSPEADSCSDLLGTTESEPSLDADPCEPPPRELALEERSLPAAQIPDSPREESPETGERLPELRTILPAATVAVAYLLLLLTSQLQRSGEPAAVPAPALARGVLLFTLLESLFVTLLAAALLRAAAVSSFSVGLWSRFGFPSRRLRDQLFTGGWGFVLALAPVYLMILATYPLRSEETLHPLLNLVRESPGLLNLSLIALTAVVVAPLKEELLFRVLLQTVAEKWLPARWAILVVALLFSAVHPFPDALAIVPLGLILGWVFHRTRSYWAVVALHALFNFWNLLALGMQMLSQELVNRMGETVGG